eukprot:4334519-Lingulodinium_polyedra.AAC.1
MPPGGRGRGSPTRVLNVRRSRPTATEDGGQLHPASRALGSRGERLWRVEARTERRGAEVH